MIKLKDQKKNRKENEIFYYIRQSKNAKLNWRYVILWCCNFLIFKSCNFTKFLILKNFVKLQHQLTYSPCIRDRKFSPTFFQSQPNSFSCHSIYVKDNFFLLFSSEKVEYQKLKICPACLLPVRK